jgi:hypothetical protein
MSELRRSPRRPRPPDEDLEGPAQKYQFVVTKKSYSSLEVYHQAVLDSQKSGKSSYWPRVTVVKDVAKDCVFLQCKVCERKYSARNPSSALRGHFETLPDGRLTCKNARIAQKSLDFHAELENKGAYTVHFLSESTFSVPDWLVFVCRRRRFFVEGLHIMQAARHL